ncbi:hypothetical protein CLOSTASPAR_02491 [[Clostridium] asparagiforme DSM 15981]|uniref:Uncharacterized protein n=1 Tax=[Clostridium] asparagiforme DSM 15981 TaxID=518636 RepID=C0CZR4_9FIRM|nr:ABC transporter substrate-binding protein [Enterocloster asparagiformis]EEG55427.1 hypothetical protein CLOSTASPAR_02491 [[Clostridium] asparagiforme DSM 15981]
MMKCKIFTIIIAAALFAAAASGCSGRAGQNAGPERPVSERESGLAGTGSDASAIAPIPGDAEPPSSGGTAAPGKVAAPAIPQNWSDMRVDHSMELLYADQFSVDYYDDGFAMITIADDNRYLVVPEGEAVPNGIPDGVTVVRRPLNNIYLVATSAMDLFCSLDAVDRITLSGTDASGWYIREARQAIESGIMSYAGKYNAPDYELILSKSCDLAVESTMIYHSPEVKEQLETLGIPVLVERSSYESHPLGRMEWLKLYAVLLGREELAGELFNRQMSALNAVMGQEPTGKTVAFFLCQLQRLRQCEKTRRLCGENDRAGRGDLCAPESGGTGKCPLHHEHADGSLLCRSQGRGLHHLQQHHRRGAEIPGCAAGQEQPSGRF